MTTPQTMGSIIKRLKERLKERLHQAQANCSWVIKREYDMGYNEGYYDAIKETLDEISGEQT